ncbi:hypothetical protein D3C80_1066800 [compost metagenome]
MRSTLKTVSNNSISNSEIINDISQRKILAISRLATSSTNKSVTLKFRFSLNAFWRAKRKQCKSSVSKIRNASGQFSLTRHPNCSSIINRSNKTILGFNSFIKASKVAQFKVIAFLSTPYSFKSTIKSLSKAGLEKVI